MENEKYALMAKQTHTPRVVQVGKEGVVGGEVLNVCLGVTSYDVIKAVILDTPPWISLFS